MSQEHNNIINMWIFILFIYISSGMSEAQMQACLQFNGGDFTGHTQLKLPSIKENSPVGHVVKRFKAPERVRGINYDVAIELQGEGVAYFSYNQVTYELTLTKSVDDLADLCVPSLRIGGKCIIAIEGSMPLEYLFSLEVPLEHTNDNPPVFQQEVYELEVSESHLPGTSLDGGLITATDADCYPGDLEKADIVTYTLQSVQPKSNAFELNKTSGEIKLVKELDYDIGIHEYSLKVIASDSRRPPKTSSTTVCVHVIDEDDLPPMFDSHVYKSTLIGDRPPVTGEFLQFDPENIRAVDQDEGQDAPIEYRIVDASSDVEEHFAIDPSTGSVRQIKPVGRHTNIANGEVPGFPTFMFTVQAIQMDDPGMMCNCSVVIAVDDVNDHAPKFEDDVYNATIKENTPTGTIVMKVSADDDDYGINNEFEYVLQDQSGAFEIGESSGIVAVKDESVLDREQRQNFRLSVAAIETKSKDRKRSRPNALLEIYLDDVNDNGPVFPKTEYSYSITDGTLEGHLIGQIIASDADEMLMGNGQVRYKIIGGSPPDWPTRFSLGEKDGKLRLESDLRELRKIRVYPTYELTVRAIDQPVNFTTTKWMDVSVKVVITEQNDFAPKFLLESYSVVVNELVPAGTPIVDVKAVDQDGDWTVDYSIVGGNEDGCFKLINGYSVVSCPEIDREEVPSYVLRVKADDGIHSTEVDVEITLADANDNQPRFISRLYVFQVKENVAHRHHVGQVNATDRDEGENSALKYRIIHGEGTEFFKMDETTGDIVVDRGIDAEDRSYFLIIAEVYDQGTPVLKDHCNIRIEVIDLNDHYPTFSSESYVGHICEDDDDPMPRQEVKMEPPLYASDNDATSANKMIRYSITGPDRKIFQVDPLYGTLYVRESEAGAIDRDAGRDHYNIEMLATDKQGTGFDTKVSIRININDHNDNGPIAAETVNIKIPEDVEIDTVVGQIEASDADATEANNRLMYGVVYGDLEKFAVDETNGTITVRELLDRETKCHYCLNVSIQDTASPYNRVYTMVNITVLDVNDNKPLVIGDELAIMEGLPSGSFIGHVVISDPDDGDNIKAYVEENVPFWLNSTDGSLYTTKVLDRETKKYYRFTIFAEDQGQPSLVSSNTIKVTVLDKNDNPPSFPQNNYNYMILSTFPVGTIVATPFACDDRDEIRTPIMYTMKGEMADYFEINTKKGLITIKESIVDLASQEVKLVVRAIDTVLQSLYTEANVYLTVLDQTDICSDLDTESATTHSVITSTTTQATTTVASDDTANIDTQVVEN
ncbi:unnamed protein product [Owenia fusiformis]|uniref:Cadherin domain-containing protein n=1 Tax=Owenia fusiformis TaxID=6347 RepID=A0A8S4N401_OWEFU|nr:unnamed protein product [Owenia fusiformis]